MPGDRGAASKFLDYDNDGNLDLFLANGHPDGRIEAHSTTGTSQLLRRRELNE